MKFIFPIATTIATTLCKFVGGRLSLYFEAQQNSKFKVLSSHLPLNVSDRLAKKVDSTEGT
jgi:hypothetical protein